MENLTWETKGTALLAKYVGEITMEVTGGFKQEVERALGEATVMVLDLSEVSFMDSSGIGFLVACNTRMQSAGKTLVLFEPSTQVRKTLGLVQLMSYFQVADSQADLDTLLGA